MNKNLKNTTSFEKNSSLQERTYYQCFCMKNYQSYSALYLHVKNKHNTNLSFKAFRSRKTNWSGSIKNIIMQFDEEVEDKKVEPLHISLRQRHRKICFKQFGSSEQEHQQLGKKTQKKIKYEEAVQIHQGKNIVNVFELYTKISETKQIEDFRKQLLTRLIAFADRHYLNFVQEKTKRNNSSFCIESSCQEIPLMLNEFFQQECAGGLFMETEAYELIRLSDWLFQNGFSTKLICNSEYLKNICKMEECNNIKAEKLQND